MQIGEPMTVATDALVAVAAIFWGVRLARTARATRQRAIGWWAAAFAAIAVAAITGGAWHAVQASLSPAAADSLWLGTLLAAGLVGFAVLGATIVAYTAGRLRAGLLAAAAAKLVAYVLWTAEHQDFRWVILDYGSSLLIALGVHLVAWWRWRSPAGPWIAAAIAVSFAAAGVQASGVALHRHFNHNDLYHLVQVLGLWLFQRGALLARDADGGARADTAT